MVNPQKCQPGQEQDFTTCEGKCAAYMWVSEWGAGVARQSRLMSDWWQLCDWCNGGWECVCCSAVNDGSCSPWVMCSSSVVRGNQIRDNGTIQCCPASEHLLNRPNSCILGIDSCWTWTVLTVLSSALCSKMFTSWNTCCSSVWR